jgi:hypothetical protein
MCLGPENGLGRRVGVGTMIVMNPPKAADPPRLLLADLLDPGEPAVAIGAGPA